MNFEEADVFGIYSCTSEPHDSTANKDITFSQYNVLLSLLSARFHFASLLREEEQEEEEEEGVVVRQLFQLSGRGDGEGCAHMAALRARHTVAHDAEVLPSAISTDMEVLLARQEAEEEAKKLKATKKQKKGTTTTTTATAASATMGASGGGPQVHCLSCIHQLVERREREAQLLQQYSRSEDNGAADERPSPPIQLVNLKGYMYNHYQLYKAQQQQEEEKEREGKPQEPHCVVLVSAGTAWSPLFVVYCLRCRVFLPLTTFVPKPASPVAAAAAAAAVGDTMCHTRTDIEAEEGEWVAADPYDVVLSKLMLAFHLLFLLDEQKQQKQQQTEKEEARESEAAVATAATEAETVTYTDYKNTVIKNVFLFAPLLFDEEDAVEEFEKNAAVTWGAAVLPGAAVCCLPSPPPAEAPPLPALSFSVVQQPLTTTAAAEQHNSNKEVSATRSLLFTLAEDSAAVYSVLSETAEPPYLFNNNNNNNKDGEGEGPQTGATLPDDICGHVVVGFVMQFEEDDDDDEAAASEDKENSSDDPAGRRRALTQEKVDYAVRCGHYREAVRLVYIEDTASWELARVLYHCTWAEVRAYNSQQQQQQQQQQQGAHTSSDKHNASITLYENNAVVRGEGGVAYRQVDVTNSIRQCRTYTIHTPVPFFVFYYYFPILFYEEEMGREATSNMEGNPYGPPQQQAHTSNNNTESSMVAAADFPFSLQSRTLLLFHQVYLISRAVGELLEKKQL